MKEESVSSIPSSPLMQFCDYVENRLQTESFEVFRRIVNDFEEQVSPTVDSMLRLSFPTVAILPFDVTDPLARSHADLLLVRMKTEQRLDESTSIRRFHEFRMSLEAKIVVKNGDWLESIHDDFCRGEDSTLSTFVRLCHQGISVVPANPLLLEKSIELERPTPPQNLTHNDQLLSAAQEYEEASQSPQMIRKREARQHLLAEFDAVEALAPWETVFDVLTIPLPAVWHDRPHLTSRLMRFWRRLARAVWERNFWFRFPPESKYDKRRYERRRRQDAAVTSYEQTVIECVYSELGPQFFVDLDASEDRSPWWWFRRPVVDIVRLCDQDGVEASVEYIRSQEFQRFPRPPQGLELRLERRHGDGRSMWSSRAKYQYMAETIDDLKREHQDNL